MNVARHLRFVTAALAATLLFSPVAEAQYTAGVVKLVAEPARVTMKAGESITLKVTAYDAQGKPIADAPLRVGGPRGAVQYADGKLRALKAGSYTVVASAFTGRGIDAVTLDIPVTISWPTLTKLDIVAEAGRLYAGTVIAHSVKGSHADGSPRPGLAATWRTSDPTVATVDRFGNVTGIKAGAATISAESEGVTAQVKYVVIASPVARIEATIKETSVNTGDVVHLTAVARRSSGGSCVSARSA